VGELSLASQSAFELAVIAFFIHLVFKFIVTAFKTWAAIKGEMMEKDIKLGSEGDIDIKVLNGKLIVTAVLNAASGTVQLSVTQDVTYFLEKLKDLLPKNVILDGAIDAAEAAVKST